MCGIAGIIGEDTSIAIDGMNRMLATMLHRGPDEGDIYKSERAVLGQRRLSIIDLPGGLQPIANEDKSIWIICNGEIYNYKAIRKKLVESGHHFSTNSDSEVILHLYEEMGDRCVQELRGMFAFSIWDENKKRLFAARDRLGQKPFFYVTSPGRFAFASEIKALLAKDPNLAEINLGALDQYLTLRLIAPPMSMFRQINKLPPAHTVSFSEKEGLNIQRYWQLNFEPKHKQSEDDLVDELEERLIQCLKLHMVSDVPVGAFVSGGLDSTMVVGMLHKHVLSEPIQTFSMGLPYGDFDEAPYAKMVADKYNTLHREEVVTPSLVKVLPKLLWHLDEPSDPLSICSYLISEMASKHVKVVLGGDGGDELFGGYDRYYGNKYADYYALIPGGIRKHLIGPVLNQLPDGQWYKSKMHQVKWLHKLAARQGGERYAYSLSYFYFAENMRRKFYGPAMDAGWSDWDPESSIRIPFTEAMASDPVDRMLYADSCIRLPDHPVMILDRMSMAHSLEARSPFMDHEIAEFAARLPINLKVRRRSLRYIQYKLAQRYIPEAVLNRPKQGFSSALPYMLRDEYKLLYDTFLVDSQLCAAGILNAASINGLLAEHKTGKVDHGNRLWLLLNSELWFRMFIQGQSREVLTEMMGRPSDVIA